jgi:photosystem II stability/assembly factor-like uncharacterized protein
MRNLSLPDGVGRTIWQWASEIARVRRQATALRLIAVPLCLAVIIACADWAKADTTYGAISLDGGGRVSGFAQHPSGRLYGFGDSFGVHRSDDFGANWRFLQNRMTENATVIHAIAVSPLNADHVAFSGPNSIWRSVDGGESWTKNLGDLSASFTRGSKPLAYHPTKQGELWFAGNRKQVTSSLWRSTDDGATWLRHLRERTRGHDSAFSHCA